MPAGQDEGAAVRIAPTFAVPVTFTDPAEIVGALAVTVMVAMVRNPPTPLPSESLRGNRSIVQVPGAWGLWR
ncbi:hypothetical protein ASG45_00010 [Microbacterium sp. Leaf436]|nr:hypothetical protein ASG45_00010 [Microbacterium sp. Leaf436]